MQLSKGKLKQVAAGYKTCMKSLILTNKFFTKNDEA